MSHSSSIVSEPLVILLFCADFVSYKDKYIKPVGQSEIDRYVAVCNAKKHFDLLTIIEWMTTASNNLESAVVREVRLELIPFTVTMLATVTQLDCQSHWCCTCTTCVIGAKPTHQLTYIASS